MHYIDSLKGYQVTIPPIGKFLLGNTIFIGMVMMKFKQWLNLCIFLSRISHLPGIIFLSVLLYCWEIHSRGHANQNMVLIQWNYLRRFLNVMAYICHRIDDSIQIWNYCLMNYCMWISLHRCKDFSSSRPLPECFYNRPNHKQLHLS